MSASDQLNLNPLVDLPAFKLWHTDFKLMVLHTPAFQNSNWQLTKHSKNHENRHSRQLWQGPTADVHHLEFDMPTGVGDRLLFAWRTIHTASASPLLTSACTTLQHAVQHTEARRLYQTSPHLKLSQFLELFYSKKGGTKLKRSLQSLNSHISVSDSVYHTENRAFEAWQAFDWKHHMF